MRQFLLPVAAALLVSAAPIQAAAPADSETGPSTSLGTGMVSAADPRAADAGAQMLRQGGNAIDAAIATLLALNVVEPQSSGIGGGGYMVFSERGAAPVTYDGRETAPAAATGDLFMVDGKPMEFSDAQPGGKSVGVPGNLRMIALAHKQHGKLEWAKLFEPAIRLARDGFKVGERLHESLNSNKDTGAFSAQARALFYGPDGNALPVGTMVRNLAFADFLERLAKEGADGFYTGSNARAIAAAAVTSPHNPSLMTAADVTRYQPKQRPPVCGLYRGYTVCGMGPSSSGGTTVFAILKQLERFDLSALGPQSPTAWHLIAESERLAYADRDFFLADPDFQPVPVAGLIDPGYLAQRSALIAPDRTLADVSYGNVPGATVTVCPRTVVPERGTSHFVAVDKWGNVVSETSTIESAFGSGLMVNGYYLNNELTDFSFSPTKFDCPVANRVEGGKRPRSSMSPTIVYGPDGKVRLAVGAAGGSTIIAQVAKIIIGVVDWKLSAKDALALPMIFAPEDTVYVERGTYLQAMAPKLEAMGHKVGFVPPGMFKANAIEQVDGRWAGAADPRSEGAAVSE
jgi:gamma-glutamyltranspeptidase/glutathione hydrolase